MELIEHSVNNPAQIKSIELFWSEHIKLKQESGLSGAAYCRQHTLSCNRLYYWENKLMSQSKAESPFIEVKLNSQINSYTIPRPTTALCSLELNNGHQLKIHDQAVLPLLISLLSN